MDDPLGISVLIVGYHSERFIEKAVLSVGASPPVPTEVLFISNSGAALENFVRTRLPNVRVVDSAGNVGFAAGNNILASFSNGDWLLLMNPDTQLEPGTIDTMLAAARAHPEFSAFGGVEISSGGDLIEAVAMPSIGEQFRILAGLRQRPRRHSADAMNGSGVVECEMLSGSLMLVRRDTWDELGGMDDTFFLYGEDADFFQRMKLAGKRSAIVPGARYFHDRASGAPRDPQRLLWLLTGTAHFYRKHLTGFRLAVALFLQWLIVAVRFFPLKMLGLVNAGSADRALAYRAVVMQPSSWSKGYRRT